MATRWAFFTAPLKVVRFLSFFVSRRKTRPRLRRHLGSWLVAPLVLIDTVHFQLLDEGLRFFWMRPQREMRFFAVFLFNFHSCVFEELADCTFPHTNIQTQRKIKFSHRWKHTLSFRLSLLSISIRQDVLIDKTHIQESELISLTRTRKRKLQTEKNQPAQQS